MDLVISDIHADFSALHAILDLANSKKFKDSYGKFTRIINLGDVLERGTKPNQVLEKLNELSKSYELLSVMGNHDEAFLYGRQVSGSSIESSFAHQSISEKDLEFFKKNNDDTYGTQEILDKKNGLVCVHGGPLDPEKITPKDAGYDAWFYQKSWQRLTEYEEFFSPYGYHFTASSAFEETNSKIKNSIILCGHQHLEAALTQKKDKIEDLLENSVIQNEKLGKYTIQKSEIPIEANQSYLVRVGLGGPEGYYGTGEATPHFAIIQDNPKKVILFEII